MYIPGSGTYSNGTGSGTSATMYMSYRRNAELRSPSIKCTLQNDKYTVNDVVNGNGALTYPIGLLSVDEVSMAGGIHYGTTMNQKYYLSTGNNWWTVSPCYFGGSVAIEWRVGSLGYTIGDWVTSGHGVRPVINLRSDTLITQGSGIIKRSLTFLS